jgi:hypothetical protein
VSERFVLFAGFFAGLVFGRRVLIVRRVIPKVARRGLHAVSFGESTTLVMGWMT